jgi:hypothetical protein
MDSELKFYLIFLYGKLVHLERKMEKFMAILDDDLALLTTQVAQNTTITQSAVTLLNGIPDLITKAVAVALQNGATSEQLKSVTDLAAGIKASDDTLAAAITANTPTPGV